MEQLDYWFTLPSDWRLLFHRLGFSCVLLEQVFDEGAEGFLPDFGHEFDRIAVTAAFRAKPQHLSVGAFEDVDARAAENFFALRASHAGRVFGMHTAHQDLCRVHRLWRVLDFQAHIAETQNLAGVQARALHLLVVDECAVGRIQVANEQTIIEQLDQAMVARDAVVVDLKIIP